MEIKVGGQWETSTPEVWLSTSCDHSVDILHAVSVSRAAIYVYLGDASLLF